MASIASLIVRIGAQDQEIQRALASVGEKARSLDADLKKLGQSPLASGAQKSLETMKSTLDQITKAQQEVANRAVDAARGLEAIGGASRLTDTQLKQVNKALQDGISAFKALGQEAPAHLKSVADSVAGLNQPLDFMDKKILAIGTAIGTFLGNAAIEAGKALVQAGKAAFVYADQLENLSAVTGISVSALQDLETIGVSSGVSIDSLANSVEQLQKHLDDPAARQALKQMGLDYERIRNLKPEKQFLEIAQAVAAIEDPVERANSGSALFGRTWFTIAPAIKGNIEDLVKGMEKLSDAQLAAIDKAGDRFDRFVANNKRRLTGYIGDLLLAADEAQLSWSRILNPFAFAANATDLTRGAGAAKSKQLAELPDLPNAPGVRIAAGLQAVSVPDSFLENSNRQLQNIKAAAQAAEKAYEQMAQAMIDLQDETDEAFAGILLAVNGRTIGNGLGTAPAQLRLPTITGLFGSGALQNPFGGSFPGAGPAKIGSKTFDAGPLTGGLLDSLKLTANKIPDIFTSAFEGGGGAIGAVKSFATQTVSTLANLIPVVGPFVSKFVGPIIAGFSKIFGKSEESSKVSPLRDAFFKAAGGLDVLNPKVQALTGNLKAVEDVFKAKTVDDYNAAIQRLNGVLGLQDQAMADLNAAVQKYGFSIDELGPKFAQQKLNEQQGVLLKDWKLLNEAVSDHNALLEKTAGAFQEIVTGALKSGATVSEEFKGPIQELIDMGLIVDENGEKLTDLSRIKFGSLDTEFSKLTAAINNLTRALGGAVEEADNLARDREATINVRTNFDTSDMPDSSDFPVFDNAEGFASGTKGWRNFGAGTPAVLHGVEAVVTPDQVQSLMAASADGQGGPSVVVNITGPVLAAVDYVEQNLIEPILNGISRYHRAKFGRLVATVTP